MRRQDHESSSAHKNTTQCILEAQPRDIVRRQVWWALLCVLVNKINDISPFHSLLMTCQNDNDLHIHFFLHRYLSRRAETQHTYSRICFRQLQITQRESKWCDKSGSDRLRVHSVYPQSSSSIQSQRQLCVTRHVCWLELESQTTPTSNRAIRRGWSRCAKKKV